ncbi:UNVERIFIED_CONTAM: putative prolyl 4-hydroxylase 10 [Sesamum latifolium]|uniref:Prolyl 4-hydroxylase 10 n=1 Tax=Sesamum latifolium TaxID=2727402 RepID=A0AAW2YDB2_9LAMI
MAGKARQHYGRGGPPRKTSSSTAVLYGLLMLSLLIVILLYLGIFSISSSSGSSKDSPKAHDLSFIAHNSVHSGDGDEENKDQWVEVISWEPRAFVFHNFLSKEECDYLISIAKPHMEKSTVVDSETGKSKDSRVRTSSGTFLARGRDKIVQRIEKRIADFTFLPVEHGEGLQILHYEVGQKYEPHYDYFLDEYNTQNGGQRVATVLMYLSDVEEGVKQYSQQQKEILVLCRGGMSYLNVGKEDFQLNQKWVAVQLSKGTSGHLQNGYVSMSTRPNLPFSYSSDAKDIVPDLGRYNPFKLPECLFSASYPISIVCKIHNAFGDRECSKDFSSTLALPSVDSEAVPDRFLAPHVTSASMEQHLLVLQVGNPVAWQTTIPPYIDSITLTNTLTLTGTHNDQRFNSQNTIPCTQGTQPEYCTKEIRLMEIFGLEDLTHQLRRVLD